MTILPVDNNPPVLSLGSTFYIQEGGVSTIHPSHLSIVDVDSKPDDIVCSITVQPLYGFLELSSPAPGSEYPRLGQPISAFSLHDLNKGHVNYKQSIHEGMTMGLMEKFYIHIFFFILNTLLILFVDPTSPQIYWNHGKLVSSQCSVI